MRGIRYKSEDVMLADFARVEYLQPPTQDVVLIGESAVEPDFDKPMTEWVEVDGLFYILTDVGGLVESTLGMKSIYFELNND
jgi:hypothetical protein